MVSIVTVQEWIKAEKEAKMSSKKLKKASSRAKSTKRRVKASKATGRRNPSGRLVWDGKRYVEPGPGQVAIFEPDYGHTIAVDANFIVYQGEPIEVSDDVWEPGVKRLKAKDVPENEGAFLSRKSAMDEVETWIAEGEPPHPYRNNPSLRGNPATAL
jgi:hypothetical protein